MPMMCRDGPLYYVIVLACPRRFRFPVAYTNVTAALICLLQRNFNTDATRRI